MPAGSSTPSDSGTSSPAARRAPMRRRARTSSRIGSCEAASRCIRSAARCLPWRSSTRATIRATRSPSPGSGASTRAATTRCMQTADRPLKDADCPPARGSRPAARRWAWSGLAVVLLGGMALRLWGIRQGLPYAYNADEADHFVPHAVRMFETGTLNPHYFSNPPAFTYLLHYLFALAYGGGAGVRRALALHPSELYTLRRVAAAGVGTAGLWA